MVVSSLAGWELCWLICCFVGCFVGWFVASLCVAKQGAEKVTKMTRGGSDGQKSEEERVMEQAQWGMAVRNTCGEVDLAALLLCVIDRNIASKAKELENSVMLPFGGRK